MSTKICLNAFDTTYAHLHNLPMAKHNVQKLLAAIKEAKGLKTQTDLAGFIGRSVSQPQVSRWMRGDQEPDRSYYDLIVAAAERAGLLDVSSEDMAAALPEPILRKTVKLKGYVGAGSEAHFYALERSQNNYTFKHFYA
jgi:transcriptional regulator with XRE-family HTH domain